MTADPFALAEVLISALRCAYDEGAYEGPAEEALKSITDAEEALRKAKEASK